MTDLRVSSWLEMNKLNTTVVNIIPLVASAQEVRKFRLELLSRPRHSVKRRIANVKSCRKNGDPGYQLL
jgi:hypothetical protein